MGRSFEVGQVVSTNDGNYWTVKVIHYLGGLTFVPLAGGGESRSVKESDIR